MDYTDLDEITETIIGVIQNAITAAGWPSTVKVLPEMLRNEHTGVGFYLFHVQENAHHKNYPSAGYDSPPVAFTPMSLNLFYQLSANIRNNEIEDAITEQKLMSVAMKVLHDNPIIKKTTPAPGLTPKDINVKITLQMLTPSESVQYWAAAESPVRLSAYYEVSVVFMQPEVSKSYAGRVLTYGNYVFVQGAPQITASQNTLEFFPPASTTLMQIKIQPAQAPPTALTPPGISSIVSFFGTGFNSGTLQVLMISPLWSEPAVASTVTLISEGRVDMVVRPTATLRDSLATVDVIPGLYSAQISITFQRTINGTLKTFNHVSNQFPFSVMPRVESITALPGGIFRIKCFLFQHGTDIKNEEIQVYTEESRLELITTGPVAAGKFKITAADTIEMIPPSTVHNPATPLRILIRGVESKPEWINVP